MTFPGSLRWHVGTRGFDSGSIAPETTLLSKMPFPYQGSLAHGCVPGPRNFLALEDNKAYLLEEWMKHDTRLQKLPAWWSGHREM